MNYSLNSNCSKPALALADEIYINSKNLDEIIEILHNYPNKKFVINFNNGTYFQDILKLVSAYDITIEIDSLNDVPRVQNQIKWYYSYPTQSFIQLNLLIDMGASEIIIGDELNHYIQNLTTIQEKTNIKYRLNPAQKSSYRQPIQQFQCGVWVRPEDMESYQIINTLYFWNDFQTTTDIKREMTLFQIYKRGYWQGPINILIKDFPSTVNNYKIKDLSSRANCQLRCLKGYTCEICKNKLKLAELIDKE